MNFLQKVFDAIDIFFDNSVNGFLATDVQGAIEELGATVGVSASPGFSWGKSGNVSNNAYLLNDGVPSNISGRTVSLTNPIITQIFTAQENINIYTLRVYEHDGDGINLVLLGSVNITTRSETFSVNIAVTTGKQLALRVSGSAKNPVVGCQLQGSV